MKPRILISRSPESSGLYEAAVEKAGGEALSFHCPDPEMDFDGLILAGGGDVDPSEFGESDLGSREIDLPRDKVELALVNRCVCENKPILGICRGHQVVNIALGGNIYQDLSPALLEVHAQTSEGKNRTHPVRLSIMTMLGDLYGQEILVNSSSPPSQPAVWPGPVRHSLGRGWRRGSHAARQFAHLDRSVSP